MIRFTGYEVIGEKPRVSHLPEIFRAPCRKNYALDRKMNGTFLTVSTSSIIAQSLFGEIVLRAPAVGAKIWCLYVLFVTLRSSGALFVRGVHSSNMYCVTVNGSILMRFFDLFRIDGLFRGTTYFSFLSLDGTTIIAKLRSKIAKSQKNRRKSLCAPFRIDSSVIVLGTCT